MFYVVVWPASSTSGRYAPSPTIEMNPNDESWSKDQITWIVMLKFIKLSLYKRQFTLISSPDMNTKEFDWCGSWKALIRRISSFLAHHAIDRVDTGFLGVLLLWGILTKLELHVRASIPFFRLARLCRFWKVNETYFEMLLLLLIKHTSSEQRSRLKYVLS